MTERRPRGLVRVGPLLEALGIKATLRHQKWEALCPAHDDHHPSWAMVDDGGDRHGLHKCFTCGFSGTAAALVMHVRRYTSWASAYEFLEPHTSPSFELPTAVRLVTRALEAFVPPREVIWDPLDRWVTEARGYARRRGLTPGQVLRWGIGYAVDGRLAGRVVFPLRAQDDRLLSYQARIFVGDGPRYLTPREDDRPDKTALFGERFWPPVGASRKRVVVWEGAIKGLAFERAVPGTPFAVLGGKEVLPEHVAKVATFREVVIATDANRAGDEAAEALSAALLRHVKVSRAILPRDPDEMDPGDVAERFR